VAEVNGLDEALRRLDGIDEVFEVAPAPIETVRVEGKHGVDGPALHVREQALPARATFTLVGGKVVIDVEVDNIPTDLGGQLATGILLAAHAEHVAPTVLGDSGVDAGTFHGMTHHAGRAQAT
jgi:hypothetical protein